jgi:DNA-binding CsgD family transcriptional regulator
MTAMLLEPVCPSLVLERSLHGAGVAGAPMTRELSHLREVLGLAPVVPARSFVALLAELDELIRAGTTRLREVQEQSGADRAEQVATLNQVLARVGEFRDEVREYRLAPRLCARPRLQASLGRLWRQTSSAAVMEVAALEASRACGLARVMLARVEDGRCTAEISHPREGGRSRRPGPWTTGALGTSGAERRVLRTMAPALVPPDPGAVDTEPARPATLAYVLAPVVLEHRVVGCCYADHGPDGPPVDEIDRDALGAFACGLALAIGRTILMERLVAQREEAHRGVMLAFNRLPDRDECAAIRAPDLRAPAGGKDSADDPLTARQREVLGLIARGATNARIAAQLEISDDTVKTHVKNIMAKLAAHSRAEALAKYHTLIAERRHGEA